MPLDALANVGEGARYGLALVATVVMAYFTYKRATGSGEDPTISLSYGDRKGYASFLLTGVLVIVFLAGGWVLGLAPEVMQQPALLLIPAAFVVVHGWFEWRESAS